MTRVCADVALVTTVFPRHVEISVKTQQSAVEDACVCAAVLDDAVMATWTEISSALLNEWHRKQSSHKPDVPNKEFNEEKVV